MVIPSIMALALVLVRAIVALMRPPATERAEYDVGQIAHSIEEYGFNDPIGIWGKDNIYEIAAEYGVGVEK